MGTIKTNQMSNEIKVLFLAAEADPLIKVGGLADVAFSLPNSLRALSRNQLNGSRIDARLVIPCHSGACLKISKMEKIFDMQVPLQDRTIPAQVSFLNLDGLPVYGISSAYIKPDSEVYSADNSKDGLKFIFFSLATLELARNLACPPDIIHANDWHTAITAYLLNRFRPDDPFFEKTKSVITVHNLPFMGSGADKALEEFGIPPSDAEHLPAWARKLPLPMGLAAADQIVTVSPSYAKEILTPKFGSGLEGFLNTQKSKLCGIINGIEQSHWNPKDDPDITICFSAQNISPRRKNKLALIEEFSLYPDLDIPLLIFIGRMSLQKGVDIALDALKMIKNEPWQAIFLGTGDIDLENKTRQMQEGFPEYFRAIIKFDARLAKRMYAGADMLLMPSRYEPCGLAQMIAMNYGCVPIANSTGGLRDTIKNTVNDYTGSGFLFEELSAKGLAASIQRAFSFFYKSTKWVEIQKYGMNNDFSWNKSALEYTKIYQRLLR